MYYNLQATGAFRQKIPGSTDVVDAYMKLKVNYITGQNTRSFSFENDNITKMTKDRKLLIN